MRKKKFAGVIFEVDEKTKGFAELIREVVRQQSNSENEELKWTGDKIQLYELGMALYLSGEFNYNQLKITRFLKLWGAGFGVDFGIPAQLMEDLMERKIKSRTFFLERLTELLRARMDELDGIGPRRIGHSSGSF